MNAYALVDCNNFYAACEKLFDPALAQRPVVVLSNNDGCVVARCPRAKALGIPMGAPVFKLRALIREHQIALRSSNYELYGDLSRRVMQILSRFCARVEVYSIDEAFLCFDPRALAANPMLGDTIRATLLRWLGLPVGIGIGPTKTLAKAANWRAKQSATGICVVGSDAERRNLLNAMPLTEIWGVGRRLGQRLETLGLQTAGAFADRLDAETVRRRFSVTLQRTWLELNGTPCIPLEEQPPAKQSICTSRSFGTAQTEADAIASAVAGFAASCAEKLRCAHLRAPVMQVFLATSRFRQDQPIHCPAGLHTFPCPTQDTLEIVAAASQLARALFRKGYAYTQAGVVVSGLLPDAMVQPDLFDAQAHDPRRRALMQSLDGLNRRFGRATIVPGTCLASGTQTWHMRQQYRTPRYTTRWDEILAL